MTLKSRDDIGIGRRFSEKTFENYTAKGESQRKALGVAQDVAASIIKLKQLEDARKVVVKALIGNEISLEDKERLLGECAGIDKQIKEAYQSKLSVLFTGQVGTGKTHLGCAMLQRIKYIFPSWSVRFENMPEYLDVLRGCYNTDTFETVFKNLLNCSVLMLDDIGAEKMTDWSIEKTQTIIDYRYREMLPTIITSNFKPSELAEAHRLGERSISRISEMCRIVEITGDDFRLK